MLLLLLLLLCGNARVLTSACPVPMPSTELILDNAHKTNRNATSVSPPKTICKTKNTAPNNPPALPAPRQRAVASLIGVNSPRCTPCVL